VGLAGEAEDVLPLLLDAAESFSGSRDRLVDDDDLHLGVVGESGNLGDRRLHLRHEVVGIGEMLDHAALGHISVFLDHQLCSAEVVFTL